MVEHAPVRRRHIAPSLWRPLVAALGLLVAVTGPLLLGRAAAASPATAPRATVSDRLLAAAAAGPGAFKICKRQTYALCATAKCFVFNDVAYCTCDVEHGDSISLPFHYGSGKDVCTANAQGAGNGYMISTFSLPTSVVKPRGRMALYTCPASTSNGAYAQCDGGYCFKSTRGQRFPGSDRRLGAAEIVCSCPITVADPQTAKVGFQIAGPYPCQPAFFEHCKDPPAGTRTGDTIYVGAPTGTAVLLARRLNGSVPPLNSCTE
jgi:hypothetical protein